MVDTTTFFARVSSFVLAFWAYVLEVLSIKHRSTTLCDDLEVGIPPGKRRISGNFNAALPVVPSSCSIDGFVDVRLNPDSKTTETEVLSIATYNVPTKASVIEADHFQPSIKIDRSVPVLFPAIPMIPQVDAVNNRSKHRVVQFGPYSLHEDYLKSRSRKRQDSFSDLLDLFPVPPTHIPPLHPVIDGDVIPQTVEKTPLAPAENCPSPTSSEEELTVSSSSGSTSTSSTHSSISVSISISISNETADTSFHEILEIPCTSTIFKFLSSGIDVKDKNISRLTLIQNPEIFFLPATDVQNPFAHSHYAIGPKSFRASTKKDLQFLDDSSTPIPNLEESSHRSLDEHMDVRAPVQDVPAAPTKWVRPYVAPLRIVKKKVQLPVALSEPLVTRRPLSGNWEQAMDGVLQAFRDAELEDSVFRDLFSGNDSFLTQGSEINTPRDDRGYLDNDEDECGRRLEESFYSIDQSLSMVIAPPDPVVLKVEDPADVSLSSERAVSRLVMMEVEDELLSKVNVPESRLCDCEGCDDSYSWTAATDEGEEDSDSQEDDQWSERFELNEYTS